MNAKGKQRIFLIRTWQNRDWQFLLRDDIYPFTWQFSQSPVCTDLLSVAVGMQ